MERDGTSHPASHVGPWRNWPACICPSLRFTWRVTRCRLSLLAGRASYISTSLLRNAADVSESIRLLYFVPSLESLLVSFAAFFFESDHEELCNFTATARQLWHVSNLVPLVGWNITSTPACNPLWFWGWILGQRAELNVKMIDTRDFLADITCCWNSFTSKRN